MQFFRLFRLLRNCCAHGFVKSTIFTRRVFAARIFLAAPIRESEIISRFGSLFKDSVICQWDKRADRVKSVRRLSLGEMPVSEKPIANCDTEFSAKIADALLDGIRHKGVENLPCWSKSAISMRERINFIHKHDNSWPEITDEVILENLSGFLSGISKWKDLEKVDLSSVMNYILSEKGVDGRELDRLAPTRMEVPSGSHMTIHYDGDLPTVEVRLQECFGLMETPKVLRGLVPIVMTLLSPAHRPIQITKDLKLFWQDSYNLVRKDMRGRYPKHYWPEDPFNAIATSRVRPKL
jgi:ATP-dependent helicase HrpB